MSNCEKGLKIAGDACAEVFEQGFFAGPYAQELAFGVGGLMYLVHLVIVANPPNQCLADSAAALYVDAYRRFVAHGHGHTLRTVAQIEMQGRVIDQIGLAMRSDGKHGRFDEALSALQ